MTTRKNGLLMWPKGAGLSFRVHPRPCHGPPRRTMTTISARRSRELAEVPGQSIMTDERPLIRLMRRDYAELDKLLNALLPADVSKAASLLRAGLARRGSWTRLLFQRMLWPCTQSSWCVMHWEVSASSRSCTRPSTCSWRRQPRFHPARRRAYRRLRGTVNLVRR